MWSIAMRFYSHLSEDEKEPDRGFPIEIANGAQQGARKERTLLDDASQDSPQPRYSLSEALLDSLP
jgi:hypothetical protein